jgi:hypothetical protein
MPKRVTPNNIETESDRRAKEEMISELILSEAIEFLIPAFFMVTFTISYYGPNAELIGGVQSELWHHVKVDDIGSFLYGAFQMILVDSLSAVISCVLLKIFCNINVFGECMKIMKRHSVFTTVFITLTTNGVGIYYDHFHSCLKGNK